MKHVMAGDQQVERCTSCAGLWFELREHERVSRIKPDVIALDQGDPEIGKKHNQTRDINCPVCQVKLLKLAIPGQSHIQYESCPICYGAYFDAGEFTDYAHLSLAEQVGLFFRGIKTK